MDRAGCVPLYRNPAWRELHKHGISAYPEYVTSATGLQTASVRSVADSTHALSMSSAAPTAPELPH